MVVPLPLPLPRGVVPLPLPLPRGVECDDEDPEVDTVPTVLRFPRPFPPMQPVVSGILNEKMPTGEKVFFHRCMDPMPTSMLPPIVAWNYNFGDVAGQTQLSTCASSGECAGG